MKDDKKLTDNFWLSELCVTTHREIDNTPPPDVILRLSITARRAQKIRYLLGNKTMTVSSGYRCPELNCVVGGAMTKESLLQIARLGKCTDAQNYATKRIYECNYQQQDSQHVTGDAIDWRCPSFGTPYEVCKFLEHEMGKGLPIDQLIQEFGWVHTGFPLNEDNSRQQLLTLNRNTGGYRTGILAT